MPMFLVCNRDSGHVLGFYEATNEHDALEVVAHDAGCRDHAHAVDVAGSDGLVARSVECAWCNAEACVFDADGDPACRVCAAKSRAWVLLADLRHGQWLSDASVPAMVDALGSLGYDVEIRSPRGGEQEGVYYLKGDGSLQLTGCCSIPTPVCVGEAIGKARKSLLLG